MLPANHRWFQQQGLVETEPAEAQPPSEASEQRSVAAEAGPAEASAAPTPQRRPVGEPPPLAFEPDILAAFADDVERAGVAGEQRLAKLLYLALTSRLLAGEVTNRPVSVIAKGTSSSGKSHTTRSVLAFLPASAYLDLGSFSKRYLFYTEDELAHRMIVIPEWTTIANDDEIVSSLRTLLSEGRLLHGTVEGEGRRTARLIDKAGPTGLLMTTTAANVDAELETRCLSVVTDDSPEQTRRVLSGWPRLIPRRTRRSITRPGTRCRRGWPPMVSAGW